MAPEIRDIQKKVLPNGLVAITETMSHVRSVSVGLWVRNGSRREIPEENGLAHFIEHMVFKGTERRSAEAIAREMDSVGGMLDAFTSKEQICFNAKVLDEHLPIAFDVIADLVLRPKFDSGREEGAQGRPRRNQDGFGQPRISSPRDFYAWLLARASAWPPDSGHAGNGQEIQSRCASDALSELVCAGSSGHHCCRPRQARPGSRSCAARVRRIRACGSLGPRRRAADPGAHSPRNKARPRAGASLHRYSVRAAGAPGPLRFRRPQQSPRWRNVVAPLPEHS